MRINNKFVLIGATSILLLSLTGCTMNSKAMSTFSTTNDADTGKFTSAKVTYENGSSKVFKNVKVYPYNNGGDDSTGGRLEIRKGNTVYVMPNNAQVELRK